MPRRRIARAVAAAVLYPLLLFGCAGTWRWPEGWIFLGLLFGSTAVMWRHLARHDPALLQERLKPMFQPGQPRWDRVLLALVSAAMIGWYVVPALDHRFGWSHVAVGVKVMGAVLFLLGAWGIHRTMCANTFLAPVVRIQEERGHRVIDTGPYGVVRHPMYACLFLYMPGASLLLGSWVGALFSSVPILLLVVRTAFEDRMLQRELEGYSAYCARVRWRLVPGIW